MEKQENIELLQRIVEELEGFDGRMHCINGYEVFISTKPYTMIVVDYPRNYRL